jgi:transcriptional regulator with XRE-family HTH domain
MEKNYKQKLQRILEITGWTREHLADLLYVSDRGLGKWLKRRSMPNEENAQVIDELYDAIVVPLECQIAEVRDGAEQRILKKRIADLGDSQKECKMEK